MLIVIISKFLMHYRLKSERKQLKRILGDKPQLILAVPKYYHLLMPRIPIPRNRDIMAAFIITMKITKY